MGKLVSICKSEKKGTGKIQIESTNLIKNFGLEGDAHAGNWHRQVSLLALEKIDDFNNNGASVKYGDFGENLVIEGYDLKELPIGTKIKIGSTLLEVTQIGKECHSKCAIYESVGDCIMPREGIFAIVIEGGTIKIGEKVEIEQ